jgi:hypothetical protein
VVNPMMAARRGLAALTATAAGAAGLLLLLLLTVVYPLREVAHRLERLLDCSPQDSPAALLLLPVPVHRGRAQAPVPGLQLTRRPETRACADPGTCAACHRTTAPALEMIAHTFTVFIRRRASRSAHHRHPNGGSRCHGHRIPSDVPRLTAGTHGARAPPDGADCGLSGRLGSAQTAQGATIALAALFSNPSNRAGVVCPPPSFPPQVARLVARTFADALAEDVVRLVEARAALAALVCACRG